MADAAPINWTNVFNVVCATILVGAETVGAGAAAGWAVAGILKLSDTTTTALFAIGAVGGVALMIAFFRSAIRAEPFR